MGFVLLAVEALSFADASMAMALTLTSSAFQSGGKIPSKYTCEGEDISPPLAIDGVPDGAKSLALIVDDPDAPDPKAPKRVWVHWVVHNLPPDTKSLPENAGKRLPKGAVTGTNDQKQNSYHGPCPPIGRHRYFHKLYALDVTLPYAPLNKPALEAAMQGHILAQTELMGTYQQGNP
jgi:Raf kinase inhibitor-like YbhB/YbcL family protein